MIVSLTSLWLPILLATVAAWIASILIHLLLKLHDNDYQPLSNEDEVATAIRNGQPTKGIHNIPFSVDMKELANETMQAKFKKGPVAFVTIFDNGLPAMGKLVLQQVLYFLFGMILIGYCASLAIAPNADYLVVFRVVSAIGFLTFGWALIPMSIWYGHLWSTTMKYLFDALVYGLLAAGVFAWLWPASG